MMGMAEETVESTWLYSDSKETTHSSVTNRGPAISSRKHRTILKTRTCRQKCDSSPDPFLGPKCAFGRRRHPLHPSCSRNLLVSMTENLGKCARSLCYAVKEGFLFLGCVPCNDFVGAICDFITIFHCCLLDCFCIVTRCMQRLKKYQC